MAFIKQTFVDGVTVVQASWLNGIQEVVGAGAVAPEYSSEQTYAVGTLVSHDSQLYICTTAIASPEAWTSGHWMATSLQALVSEQKGVFWCTYDVTTYAQVQDALSKQKLPVCPYEFTVSGTRYEGTAIYTYTGSDVITFFDLCENGTGVTLQISTQDAWTSAFTNPVVPSTRTVNGKALSSNITLDAEDIGYDDTLATHESGTVGYEIAELKNGVLNVKEIFWVNDGGLGADPPTTASEISAALQAGKFPVLLVKTNYPFQYLPFEEISMVYDYDPNTGTSSSLSIYRFGRIDQSGVWRGESLTVNHTEGTESWGSYIETSSLTTLYQFNEIKEHIALDYSTSRTYAVGDYVYRYNELYRCKVAITTAEAWNYSHWDEVKLCDDLAYIRKTDTTLSVVGKAADAKAVGDALQSLTEVYWATDSDTYATISTAINANKLIAYMYNITSNNVNYKGVAFYDRYESSSASHYAQYVFCDCTGYETIKIAFRATYLGSTYYSIQKTVTQICDTTVSSTSTHPLENRAIKAYVDSVGTYGMNVIKDLVSTDITLDAQPETRYIYGELDSLDITSVPSDGIVNILFQSGTTPTVVSLPNTVKMPSWYYVGASMTVMIGITDGVYGSVQTWAY